MNLEKLHISLINHEGLKLVPYIDTVGVKTIGVGHNMDKNPLPIQMAAWLALHGSITYDMAIQLLDDDIQAAKRQLQYNLKWFENEDEVRQRALLELAFNLGMSGLMAFKYTLAYWKSHQYELAANELLNSKWATQVGNRSKVIAEMVRTGEDE